MGEGFDDSLSIVFLFLIGCVSVLLIQLSNTIDGQKAAEQPNRNSAVTLRGCRVLAATGGWEEWGQVSPV